MVRMPLHKIAPGRSQMAISAEDSSLSVDSKAGARTQMGLNGIGRPTSIQVTHQINQRQYEKAWEAIVKRTRLNDS